MFQVSVDETFSAGHALRGYKGKCENPHGHNYKVRVVLEGPSARFHRPALRFHAPETSASRNHCRSGPQVSERPGALRRHQSFRGKSGQIFLRGDYPAAESRAGRRETGARHDLGDGHHFGNLLGRVARPHTDAGFFEGPAVQRRFQRVNSNTGVDCSIETL